MAIPFNKPFLSGKEEKYILDSINSRKLCGDNYFTKRCESFIQQKFQVKRAFLTPSCTDALEMAALLINLKPQDEVILPSYTFSSTANAICLRGAKPIFVDIRQDTFNINENKIEEAITNNTKAIFPIAYGGVSPDMDKIMKIAEDNNL